MEKSIRYFDSAATDGRGDFKPGIAAGNGEGQGDGFIVFQFNRLADFSIRYPVKRGLVDFFTRHGNGKTLVKIPGNTVKQICLTVVTESDNIFFPVFRIAAQSETAGTTDGVVDGGEFCELSYRD